MASIHPVSLSRYASKRWQRPSGFLFAREDAVVPVTIQELPRAIMMLPIGFVAAGDQFRLCVIQGLATGKNLLVAPNGRWLAGYIPAVYRVYPFAIAETENDNFALCFNEDSGLLVEEGSNGQGNIEAFFTEEGKPTDVVNQILGFLTQVAKGRQRTQQICSLLQKHNLIHPWPIKVKLADGEQTVQGLFRIDENVLNELSDEAFLELRRAGALPVIYAQLYSMQHLPKLGQFAQAVQQAEAANAQNADTGDLDLNFLNGKETISFN